MKRTPLIILLLAAALAASCISTGGVTHTRILRDMGQIKNDILKGKDPALYCRGKSLGKSGFYYLIDTEGIILCHPQGFLEGRSYGTNPFIKEMIEKKTGCYRYPLGETWFSIYYLPLTDNVILCLSIMTAEIRGDTPSCTELQ